MTTTTRTVTQKQAEAVLDAVAVWLGKKGLGVPICPEGRTLGGLAGLKHTDDDTWCDTDTFGPAPTGPEAAHRGEGPELVMAWDWADGAPSILLEGGPYDWAIDCTYMVQRALDAKGIKVHVEPYTGYALSIYPG